MLSKTFIFWIELQMWIQMDKTLAHCEKGKYLISLGQITPHLLTSAMVQKWNQYYFPPQGTTMLVIFASLCWILWINHLIEMKGLFGPWLQMFQSMVGRACALSRWAAVHQDGSSWHSKSAHLPVGVKLKNQWLESHCPSGTCLNCISQRFYILPPIPDGDSAFI